MSRQRKPRKAEAAAKPRPLEPPRLPREPAAGTPAKGWVSWLVPSLIALVTFAAFLPTLYNQFVAWDDDKNILDNSRYRGLGWPQLHWMWTTFHMGHYIPLTWMTFGGDYLLWGMKPLGYHLTSLLLHATNAVVFYFVALRVLRVALPGPVDRGHAGLALSAGFAAIVFAVHPLRVESVAWATERRDALSGLFYLLTLLAYLRACERGERGRGWHWMAVGLFACALLSKSMAVSLPVVLLILDLYPLRRLGGPIGWWSAPARRVYGEKVPFVLLAGAATTIAFLALVQVHNMAPLEGLGVLGRLAVSAYGLSFYLWKMIVPLNLSPLYELTSFYELGKLNPWAVPFIVSHGVVLAITALTLGLRRRWPGLPAVWLAYVVILLPVLGIFQNGPQIAADRYTYLAGLGWAILAGVGFHSCRRLNPLLVTGAAICMLLVLGVLTWNQVQVWHDSERFWTHALAIDPESPMAHNGLGHELAQQHKLTEAIEHYRRALRIKPNFADPHINWGIALAEQGKPAEAIEHYERALHIKPDSSEAHYNLGGVLVQQGKPAEAIDHFREALRMRPDFAEAHNTWGVALARQSKLTEAIDQFREALDSRPAFAAAHYNLGVARAQQGKPAEAIEHYQQALRIKPDHADAHDHWGNALAQQGRLAEAIEQYRQALRIKPDHADAHSNWGLALIQQGRMLEAIPHFQQALQIRPQHSQAQSDLLDALLGQGRGQEGAAPSRKGKRAE